MDKPTVVMNYVGVTEIEQGRSTVLRSERAVSTATNLFGLVDCHLTQRRVIDFKRHAAACCR